MTPRELADKLIGTCDSIDPEEELGSDIAVLREFDDLAFVCDTCGWWCGTDEAYDCESGHGFVCEQCYNED